MPIRSERLNASDILPRPRKLSGFLFTFNPMKKQAATVHRKRVRVKLGRHTKHANKHRRTKAYKGQGR